MQEPIFTPWSELAATRGRDTPEVRAPGLWCAGNLAGLTRPCVAVVGTRAATPAGKRLARRIAADLGAAGCTILSGLALGIDAAAHEGALDAGAATVGVLGCGHHHFFPRRNRALADRMLGAGGAVVSPYPPQQPAKPGQFLQRNGVVAALADAVLVVEAPARSGALNTAGWAAGRIPVLAVPGDVDRPAVAGCLALLRDGALLARHAADVLEALGLTASPAPDIAPVADGTAGALLRALEPGPANLDELTAATGINPASALATLALLELRGLIECDGVRYARSGTAPK